MNEEGKKPWDNCGSSLFSVGKGGGDTWKVARARQGLACSGSAAEANLPKPQPHPHASAVYWKDGHSHCPTSPKRLRGRAISPKAPRPQTWIAAEPNRRRPDRSEIGPYLGGPRAASGGAKKPTVSDDVTTAENSEEPFVLQARNTAAGWNKNPPGRTGSRL